MKSELKKQIKCLENELELKEYLLYLEYNSKIDSFKKLCNHKYDDETCAKISRFNFERYCDICGEDFY